MAGLQGAAVAAEGGAARGEGASWLAQFSWAMYDGARAPYNTLVNIFVFSAYFTTVVIADSVRGQVVWSYITSVAALFVAIGAPVLGAIADAGGRRKPWLIGCLILGIPCTALVYLATPGMTDGLWVVILALVGAAISFEYAGVFANSMLPNVAPAHKVGFLSGLGLTLGNVSTIILFGFFLWAWSWNDNPLFGLDKAMHEPERAVGPLAAIWLLIFSLPLFFFTPDAPGSKLPMLAAVKQGLANLLGTIKKVKRYKNTGMFLIARMTFNEGFIVLIIFTGIFAAGILHWTPEMLIVEGLINSVVAALGGLFSGWLDQRIGPKKSVMFFVAGCLVSNIILFSITPGMIFFVPIDAAATATGGIFPTLPDKVFLVTQAAVAFFVTGGFAESRALMAKLSPKKMLTEFFGLFALSGTATAFIGPLAIGLMTDIFQSQRAGVIVGVAFFAGGLLLMTLVKEEAPPEEPA